MLLASTISSICDLLVPINKCWIKALLILFSGCPVGQFLDSGACAVCTQGTYSASFGSTECVSCTGDQTTENEGSTAADQCGTYTF